MASEDSLSTSVAKVQNVFAFDTVRKIDELSKRQKMQLCEQTLDLLRKQGQAHLVQFWDELNEEQQRHLQHQIEEIDFILLRNLIEQRNAKEGTGVEVNRAKEAKSPEQLVRLPQNDAERAERENAKETGLKLLQAGKVGAILVAGGQGSRLGFDLPKGMFPIGPVSQRTLFQVLCEQLLARSRQAGVAIPYFVMTSEATHHPTTRFFRDNGYFGLGEENVFFFQQASLPAIDDSSPEILLSEKGKISTSPDGHGGTLRALQKHGMFDVMNERGIEHLFYHQVDNPTAIVCDPVMLGLHEKYQSDLTTKVVAKATPEEKMGVLVSIAGKTEIIEYSDLSNEDVHRKDESGNNIFWAGNTAIHVFRKAFLETLLTDEFSLPFHIAHKKIVHIDTTGALIEPASPNGHKFEQFIFDALPHTNVALVVEGDRNREFNPVKNAEGNDSPQTSRAAMQRIAREWIQAAGGTVADGVKIEISPLYALDEVDLKTKNLDGKTFTEDAVLN